MEQFQKATITAQYVNPPKDGKPNGSIKDTNGRYWSAKPEYLSQVQPGMTFGVEYRTSEFNGKTYYFIEGLLFNGQTPAQTMQQPAQQAYVPPQTTVAPQPTPKLAVIPPSDKEEGMFIMGVVGRAMGSGKYETKDIPALTQAAVLAWRTRHATPVQVGSYADPQDPGPQLDQQLNDAIPF